MRHRAIGCATRSVDVFFRFPWVRYHRGNTVIRISFKLLHGVKRTARSQSGSHVCQVTSDMFVLQGTCLRVRSVTKTEGHAISQTWTRPPAVIFERECDRVEGGTPIFLCTQASSLTVVNLYNLWYSGDLGRNFSLDVRTVCGPARVLRISDRSRCPTLPSLDRF